MTTDDDNDDDDDDDDDVKIIVHCWYARISPPLWQMSVVL